LFYKSNNNFDYIIKVYNYNYYILYIFYTSTTYLNCMKKYKNLVIIYIKMDMKFNKVKKNNYFIL